MTAETETGTRPSHQSHAGRRPTPRPAADTGLRGRYHAYRRRQGAALLALVPRDGIRSLYRAARARDAREDERRDAPREDAVGMLTDFCTDLLPLPPFDLWLADFEANRAAHREEAEDWTARAPAEPVTVEIRRFPDPDGRTWYASLDVRRAGGAWRGSVAFHAESDGRVLRTGEVFRESDAAAVRSRFLGFDVTTLQAFLRSVLP